MCFVSFFTRKPKDMAGHKYPIYVEGTGGVQGGSGGKGARGGGQGGQARSGLVPRLRNGPKNLRSWPNRWERRRRGETHRHLFFTFVSLASYNARPPKYCFLQASRLLMCLLRYCSLCLTILASRILCLTLYLPSEYFVLQYRPSEYCVLQNGLQNILSYDTDLQIPGYCVLLYILAFWILCLIILAFRIMCLAIWHPEYFVLQYLPSK